MMKFINPLFFLLLTGTSAWTVPHSKSVKSSSSSSSVVQQKLQQENWITAAVATAFTVATIAMAPTPAAASSINDNSMLQDQPQTTLMVAAGAYIPENSFMSTDLSLPKYDVVDTSRLVKPDPQRPEATPKRQQQPTTMQRIATKQKTAEELARDEKIMARRIADLEKAKAMKAEKAALQAKRLEQIGKVAVPMD